MVNAALDNMEEVIPPPPQWSKEVSALYAPLRVIGKGGFANVWMASKKKPSPSSKDDDSGDKDLYVAIKVVGNEEYAQREVAILSELSKYSHPNIVRLLHDFNPNGDDKVNTIKKKNGDVRPVLNKHRCIVLSLARGPTLHFILRKGGALGLIIAQSISQQLISAVAFLHGHGVIHRDIQPCNIIVSGALIDDEVWWSDELDVDGKVLKMAQQCHITLIDFGFARALGPSDMKNNVGLIKFVKENGNQMSAPHVEGNENDDDNFGLTAVNQVLLDASFQSRGRSRTRDLDASLSNSSSYRQVRDLSALGTRNYAAPEILNGIRKVAVSLSSSLHKGCSVSDSGNSQNNYKSQTSSNKRTISGFVSDYGMVADAFSVGATIRHMVTGVPPNLNVEEFIALKNHPLKKMFRSLRLRIGNNNRSSTGCHSFDTKSHSL